MPLRTRLIACVLSLALVALPLLTATGAGASTHSRSTMTALEQSTVDQINALRTSHGLAPLAFSRALLTSASVHSQEMVADGYFSHTAADGETFDGRIERYYRPRGTSLYGVGENLFWTLNTASSATIVSAWMKSPDHRANLLKPDWRQIGLAAVQAPSAPGVYDGRSVTVVTVDFGVRR
jgi:uncharacterized protein YkwD